MLLRLNKQDQIEALKSIGFTTVNENTPASDIAKYMQWSGTLLDLSLATLRIEDGEQVFFTASEWNSMSANNRSKYIRIGIRLRAECHQFIIAKGDCIDAGGNKTFKWGGYGTDLRGLKKWAALAGPQFRLGVVLYDGTETLPLGDGLWAAPLSSLGGD